MELLEMKNAVSKVKNSLDAIGISVTIDSEFKNTVIKTIKIQRHDKNSTKHKRGGR
jgi:hypothetical protein